MQRISILLFGGIAYLFFLLVFLYFIAFVGNVQLSPMAESFPIITNLVPHSLDAGREAGALVPALLINAGLILLFGLQHSIMARTGFKQWLTTHLPAPAERSVFVLMANLYGWFRVFEPLLRGIARRERQRTVKALKSSMESAIALRQDREESR